MKKLFALLLLFPGLAWGACTSPAGAETDLLYNGDFHTYQYCDGTSWQAVGGGSTSWYYLNAIPTRVQAVSNGTPIDLTGLTVTGQVSGMTIISTAVGGVIQTGSVSASSFIAGTGGISATGQVSAVTAYVGGLTERVLSSAAATSTTLINVSGAGLIVISPTVSTTISLTNALPGKSVQILVKQPSGGGVVITFTSPTHRWANTSYTSGGGLTSTTQTTSGSTVSEYVWTTDDGRNWYGGLAGSGM